MTRSEALQTLTSDDPAAVLRAAFNEFLARNPRYSLRAFARSTGISHTVLSLVLSGKRRLSKKATTKLADFLGLDPIRRQRLLNENKDVEGHYENMPLDTFEVISDWYHYAILSILELPEAKFEAKWLAKQLGLQEIEAKMAMDRLKRLSLVAQDKKGRWRQSSAPIKIDNTLSTVATRKFHKQLLNRAEQSIEQEPIENRDFSSMTFAMDASQIEYASKKIRAFRRKLTAELEKKSSPNAVFNLTVQLYPITPILKNNKNSKENL